jgi:hypothetical protein
VLVRFNHVARFIVTQMAARRKSDQRGACLCVV